MLSRVQAETVLRPHSEGSYLVRQVLSTNSNQNLTSSNNISTTSNQNSAAGSGSGSSDQKNLSRSREDLGRVDYSLALK